MFRSPANPPNHAPARVAALEVEPRWQDLLASSLGRYLPSQLIALEILERGFISLLYASFAYRLLATYTDKDWFTLALVLTSESLPVILINIRKMSDNLSFNPVDWVLAFCGTTAPLLADCSVATPPVAYLREIIVVLILGGMCVQISAKVFLWRSFGIVAANRGVKMGGPYRVVRHPMYAGYTIAHVGTLLAFPSLFNATLYASALALQVARLLREERILRQDPVYQEFASRVRYRLLPGVF